MKIYDELEQGTDEWLRVRMGIPTASVFIDAIRKPGPRGGVPKTRQTYMYKLAGELLSGEPMDNYQNAHMQRGTDREDEARKLYALMYDAKPVQVGFIRNGDIGCSPDALIEEDGMLELKDRSAHIQIALLLDKKVPSADETQCMGQLLVSGRMWVDYASHCRGLPLFVKRINRDERRIAEIKIGLQQFNKELQALVTKIRSM